mmetsp:Transcript_11492/g.39237  ORF Transcript_11492/g.39237 Transcript_11492/m.39237 type:complete len:200 (+) Transcript_11492:149-748(+)
MTCAVPPGGLYFPASRRANGRLVAAFRASIAALRPGVRQIHTAATQSSSPIVNDAAMQRESTIPVQKRSLCRSVGGVSSGPGTGQPAPLGVVGWQFGCVACLRRPHPAPPRPQKAELERRGRAQRFKSWSPRIAGRGTQNKVLMAGRGHDPAVARTPPASSECMHFCASSSAYREAECTNACPAPPRSVPLQAMAQRGF